MGIDFEAGTEAALKTIEFSTILKDFKKSDLARRWMLSASPKPAQEDR